MAAEAGSALTVAAATVVIFAATLVWWVAVAEHAPSFLRADRSVPLNAPLVATAALMAMAAVAAAGRAVRPPGKPVSARTRGRVHACTARCPAGTGRQSGRRDLNPRPPAPKQVTPGV